MNMMMEKHSQKQSKKKENYLASTGVVIISVKHTNNKQTNKIPLGTKLYYVIWYDDNLMKLKLLAHFA